MQDKKAMKTELPDCDLCPGATFQLGYALWFVALVVPRGPGLFFSYLWREVLFLLKLDTRKARNACVYMCIASVLQTLPFIICREAWIRSNSAVCPQADISTFLNGPQAKDFISFLCSVSITILLRLLDCGRSLQSKDDPLSSASPWGNWKCKPSSPHKLYLTKSLMLYQESMCSTSCFSKLPARILSPLTV